MPHLGRLPAWAQSKIPLPRLRDRNDNTHRGFSASCWRDRLLAQGEKLPFLQVARHGGVACGARIVCYQDDGFLKVPVQSGEYIENLFGRVRVQVARGFIGHEQRGVGNNGARNLDRKSVV